MGESVVQDVLQRIDALSEQDRDALERHLARRRQAEWDRETGDARRLAKERCIDQAAIDHAVEATRYGR